MPLQLILCAPEGWSRSEGLSFSFLSPLSAVYQHGSLPKASLTLGLSLLIKWQWEGTEDIKPSSRHTRPYLGRDSGLAFYGFVVCFLQDRVLLERLIWPGTSYVVQIGLESAMPLLQPVVCWDCRWPWASVPAALLFQWGNVRGKYAITCAYKATSQ